MKKITAILLASVMMLSLMAGCTGGGTGATQPSTTPTQESTAAPTEPTTLPTTAPTETEPTQTGSASTTSAQILSKIWTEYADDERFACYGGTVEHSMADAPGDLDMTNTEEITNKYLLPQEQLESVESGASLVHLMNSNIFTAAAFQLKEGADVREAAKALRDNIQKTQWLCGQPDQLLVADVDGHLLMAFAAKENMDIFRQKLNTAYESTSILYDEAVTA